MSKIVDLTSWIRGDGLRGVMGSYQVLSMIHFGIIFRGVAFTNYPIFAGYTPGLGLFMCAGACFYAQKQHAHFFGVNITFKPMLVLDIPNVYSSNTLHICWQTPKKWSPILVRKFSSVIRGEWIVLVWKPILFGNSKLVCTVSVWPSLTTCWYVYHGLHQNPIKVS